MTHHTPAWLYVQLLSLFVSGTQIFQRIERKCDVHKAATIVVLIRGTRDIDDCNPVMLVIVRDERQILVFVNDLASQEVDIKAFHVVELVRLQDHMSHLGRRQDLALLFLGDSHDGESAVSRVVVLKDWSNAVELEYGMVAAIYTKLVT